MSRPALRVVGLVLAILLTVAAFPAWTQSIDETVVLRPGDVLSVELPGEPALDGPFPLDRRGEITLPEVGRLELNGRTLDEARAAIRGRLQQVFRDIDRLDVRLDQRRLLLTVLGYVQAPGEVDLAAGVGVQGALAAAGGLRPGAQLDRLQLRRDGSVTVFNYKDWLDTGDPSVLPVLRSLDTIFVPASPLIGNVQADFDAQTLQSGGDAGDEGTSIRVFGEVVNPGNFGFRDGTNVLDYILRAGGVTRFGSPEHIRVVRGSETRVFDLKAYLDNPAIGVPAAQPGTTIFVPTQREAVDVGSRTVYVMGEVANPGAFETREGAGFLDIIANAGGPTRFAETRQIRILRADGSVVPVDLQAYTEGTLRSLPEVRPGDSIFVPEKSDPDEPSWLDVPPTRAVSVLGAVLKPGRYEWSDEMTLLDLIASAGGPTITANPRNIRVTPTPGSSVVPRTFDLERFVTEGGRLSDIPTVRGGYTVFVPEAPRDPTDSRSQWVQQATEDSIYVLGEVGAPGRYAFDAKFTFLDILSAAQGPTSGADLYNLRITHNQGPAPRVSNVNLARYFETGDPNLLPRVLPGDVIYVPDRDREWLEEPAGNTIRIIGEINRPGRYRFDERMTILDLLAEAGGPTSGALIERIVIVNLSCCPDEARVFNLGTFARTGDPTLLPVIRTGDTIYVPSTEQSNYRIFINAVRDAVSVVALIAIIAAL